ncbi:MAG: glycogen/starch/alpha-glucan phosphorylase [Ruminococcaceae bacterium]|nr:glycogen/starch/alpha-glucan phosphorylase [Oscillospiraceae bacterium]
MEKSEIMNRAKEIAAAHYCRPLSELTAQEVHYALSQSVMAYLADNWNACRTERTEKRRAYYLSAEFLVGRLVYNNLLCLGLTETVEEQLKKEGLSLSMFEDVEDTALGNGGLGRLAACFLDSAASLGIPLDGYGIRYKYGIFRQTIENGFQKEYADDWSRFGDPWSVRRIDEAVTVRFGKKDAVRAVPYDMPVIGWEGKSIGTLRLWQAEPMEEFDFVKFNDQNYDEAVAEKNRAEDISRVLYPNDSTREGKLLRLRQQYFFSSASLQDMIRRYKRTHGTLDRFADMTSIQLNDTHPVISIPELIRLLTENEGYDFDSAFEIARAVFNYTNHTVMQEALEKWEVDIVSEIAPACMRIIKKIDTKLSRELASRRVPTASRPTMKIVQGTTVHMANLAVFCSRYINGVAALHTKILMDSVLSDWYKAYPERFQNKTNGITQRRWLALCNPELSALITELLGDDKWVTDLDRLKALEKYADDEAILRRFMDIKSEKRSQLADFVKAHDGVDIDPDWIFDIQIKRLHEYKRQLLNAFSILGLYFLIKDGVVKDFTPTVFLFGAKSAPGYARAKGIIKFINEVAKLIEADPEVSPYIKVVFVQNYNVSYAEKLVAAADVSVQISTAGTEASGTGNMKFMLNGAVTLGTYDGANVEIVEEAGEENNYIFGARVEEIEAIKPIYDPKKLYNEDELIRRVVDTLTDGTLSDGRTKAFRELKSALLKGASWHQPDHYFLLHDFRSFIDARLRLNKEYNDRLAFARKCWLNMCNAGKFSSDRTIKQYASEIWHTH